MHTQQVIYFLLFMLFPNGFCHFCPYHHLSRSHFNVFLSIWNGKSFVTYPEKKKNLEILLAKTSTCFSLERRKRYSRVSIFIMYVQEDKISTPSPSAEIQDKRCFGVTTSVRLLTQRTILFTCMHRTFTAQPTNRHQRSTLAWDILLLSLT